MLRKLRHRLTYANVMSSMAFFLALTGGTAFAVTAIDDDSVFSRHIVDGEVKGADLGVNSIGSGKVIDDSLRGRDVTGLTGGDVTDGSLGGADVAESSLGQVPSAASANSANSATTAGNTNGLELRAFHYAENANSSVESIFSLGGVSVGADCSSTGNLSLVAQSHINGSYIRASNGQTDATFDNGQQIDLDTPDNDGARTFSFRRGPAAANSSTFDSNSVSVSLSFDEGAAAGPQCQASGTGIGRP